MSMYDELLATVRVVRDRTGDPNAWQAGLTPNELTAVVTPATHGNNLAAISTKIRQQHPDLFDARAKPEGTGVSGDEEGAAAEAIAGAEVALAHQNSASSQLDLQVISAIMNAHLKTVEGREALTALQRETEAAVQTRSDLDTPVGARDFQRFLIGKLRDIRAVVMTASLDDTSKSALMAAWTSLYDASTSGLGETRPAATPVTAPVNATAPLPAAPADAGGDPLLDSLLAEDPALLNGDPAQDPAAGSSVPITPTTPSIPNLGGVPLPGVGTMGGWGAPGGLPASGRQEGGDPSWSGLDDNGPPDSNDPDASGDEPDHAKDDEHHDEDTSAQSHEAPPSGPTAVTLPDGETVTAASPQLAAAIKAAAGGVPIADAFAQQGITIPAPGTTVSSPLDPVQVIPGDIGIFTDRHALGLGHGKALLDGQIQHIATVSGPSFLGWEHPPATATAPATTDTPTPTPTRPAATSTTEL
ncbi:hypothetical protein MNAB215_1790 [Mycobacterium numidiamassiliense]|uniref:Biofilm regulator BssS n=1 Tax=Mycobacterium numidiamassiliense TaxID=1841861 RepID=A0A2U3P774_9MYCO|nr:DUF4226 domain-containing protein [Mycobacterium numidiamassiliense]SPM39577.1 hypothetical protein MNAB215_1763 [Mycobacterium numidiamassiliense]SPM39604.1 hypothetical protein MNAB215_1790 [Mycobacterium numidiamassiliense]